MNNEKRPAVGRVIADTSRVEVLKWFVLSAALVLFITGAAKVLSVFGNNRLLNTVDPIVGIKLWQLMLAVGWGEIAIALVCVFGKRTLAALGLVAWINTNFLVYRFGLWWVGWKKPCSCLGNLTDALHISPQTVDNIMKVVLAYLLIGSYGLLIWQWKQRRTIDQASAAAIASS